MFVFIFLTLIALIVYPVFAIPMKAAFLLDSSLAQIRLRLDWLSPLLRIEVFVTASEPRLSIYFLNAELFSKTAGGKGKRDLSMLKALSLRHTRVRIQYGLDPHITGMLFGALHIIQSVFDFEDLDQQPEFVPESEYVRISASSEFMIGQTAVNFFLAKRNQSKRRNVPWTSQT